MPARRNSFWTDDSRVERLKMLWRDGWSASQIGADLKTSRSAVLGKLARLGLLRGGGMAKHRPARPATNRATGAVRKIKNALVRPPVNPEPVIAPPRADAPAPRKLSILELTNTACRYIYGSPARGDHFYCGIPEAEFPGEPYCKYHRSICFNGFTPRRGRPAKHASPKSFASFERGLSH